MSSSSLWQRFQHYFLYYRDLGFSLETDQHAYLQQLRDGVLNFFVTFIEVESRAAITSTDFCVGHEARSTRVGGNESP
jgi:hypothetical protein